MTVFDLLQQLNELNKEIHCNGKKIASHNLQSSVTIIDEDNQSFGIESIELDRLFGCGCPDGVVFNIKRLPL